MGRKRIKPVVKCGECGKPSVEVNKPTWNTKAGNKTRTEYTYWVHLDTQERPKSHTKEPTGYQYPCTPKDRNIPYADQWMMDNIIQESKKFLANWKKFMKLIYRYPIRDKDGSKKSVELINKFTRDTYRPFLKTVTTLFNGYDSILADIYNSKLTDERKMELRLEEMKYFFPTFILCLSQLSMWNSTLSYINLRSGESKLGWLKIIKEKIEQGDHAASSKYSIKTGNVKRKFSTKQIHNKKIPELESLKDHILRTEKRKMADKELLKYIDKMIDTLEKDPLSKMLEFIYNYIIPGFGHSIKSASANRRVRLRDKLSESAF